MSFEFGGKHDSLHRSCVLNFCRWVQWWNFQSAIVADEYLEQFFFSKISSTSYLEPPNLVLRTSKPGT